MPVRAAALVALLFTVVLTAPAEAQFGRRLTDALKRNAENKAINKAVETQDKAIDAAANAAAGGEEDSTAGAPPAPPAPPAAPAGRSAATAGAPAKGTAAPAPAAGKEWANYDFVPGNRVLFLADFADDRVGNFPKRLTYVSGQMEVVDLDGQKVLKASDQAELQIPLPEVLPERYTVEVDYIAKNGRWDAFELGGGAQKNARTTVRLGSKGVEVYQAGRTVINAWLPAEEQKMLPGTLVNARFQGDGAYLKVYSNTRRIVNIPNADLERARAIRLTLFGASGGDAPVYITRIRVAETPMEMYDALEARGTWSTGGILFETAKADIRPESTPTLKAIAATLRDHPELKVEIGGHTDNVGAAAANQKLSDARAAAVKAALVGTYGIDAARLTTRGYGDTKPAVPNTTPENRASNRRVELRKI